MAPSTATRSSNRVDVEFVFNFSSAEAFKTFVARAADNMDSPQGLMLQTQPCFARGLLVSAIDTDAIGIDFDPLLSEDEAKLDGSGKIAAIQRALSLALRTIAFRKPVSFDQFMRAAQEAHAKRGVTMAITKNEAFAIYLELLSNVMEENHEDWTFSGNDDEESDELTFEETNTEVSLMDFLNSNAKPSSDLKATDLGPEVSMSQLVEAINVDRMTTRGKLSEKAGGF